MRVVWWYGYLVTTSGIRVVEFWDFRSPQVTLYIRPVCFSIWHIQTHEYQCYVINAHFRNIRIYRLIIQTSYIGACVVFRKCHYTYKVIIAGFFKIKIIYYIHYTLYSHIEIISKKSKNGKWHFQYKTFNIDFIVYFYTTLFPWYLIPIEKKSDILSIIQCDHV